MKTRHSGPGRIPRAYTLIEALVASGILMFGVAAASSMSLAFVTQEEIAERAEKALSHLENAVTLYQCGVDPSEIPSLLPPSPVVTSLTFADRSLTASNFGTLPSVLVTVTWKSSGATESTGLSRWTGGLQEATRTASVEVVRVDRTIPSPMPRTSFFSTSAAATP